MIAKLPRNAVLFSIALFIAAMVANGAGYHNASLIMFGVSSPFSAVTYLVDLPFEIFENYFGDGIDLVFPLFFFVTGPLFWYFFAQFLKQRLVKA